MLLLRGRRRTFLLGTYKHIHVFVLVGDVHTTLRQASLTEGQFIVKGRKGKWEWNGYA
jgi:hypothetical protein